MVDNNIRGNDSGANSDGDDGDNHYVYRVTVCLAV